MKLAPSPSPSSGFILKGRSTCQLLGLATLEAHTHTHPVLRLEQSKIIVKHYILKQNNTIV